MGSRPTSSASVSRMHSCRALSLLVLKSKKHLTWCKAGTWCAGCLQQTARARRAPACKGHRTHENADELCPFPQV